MGEDPSGIRAQIEQTRARVGDEVDALSYKTNVSARVSDYVEEKKQAVRSTFTEAKGTLSDSVPDTGAVKRAATHVRETAASNPLGLAVGGLAVGFVVGTLLPQTQIENQQMGAISDRLVDAAKDTASEAVARGAHVAQEAAEAALDTAKQSGGVEVQELTSTLQGRTQEQTHTSGA